MRENNFGGGNPPRVAHILGNGQSLTTQVIDSLEGEITFACNRIHLHPSYEAGWRPTYYCRIEPPMHQEVDSEQFFKECLLHAESGVSCIFPHWERELGGENRDNPNPKYPNVSYWNTCKHVKYGVDKAPSSWHLPLICDFGTVVTAMMQIAVIKGFDKIVLHGCDLTGGHFTEDYGDSLIQTELWKKAHEIAARSCPIPIEWR